MFTWIVSVPLATVPAMQQAMQMITNFPVVWCSYLGRYQVALQI